MLPTYADIVELYRMAKFGMVTRVGEGLSLGGQPHPIIKGATGPTSPIFGTPDYAYTIWPRAINSVWLWIG